MLNTETLFEANCAENSSVPALLMAMPLGVVPSVGKGEPGIVVNEPSVLMSKAAMVLVMALDAYRRCLVTTMLAAPTFVENEPPPPVRNGDPERRVSVPPVPTEKPLIELVPPILLFT